jgi:predicted Zn-dependent peptidase
MKTLGELAGGNGKRRMHNTCNFQHHFLKNGVSVWLQSPVIQTDRYGYVSVFFSGAGSHADPPGLKGLAHFAEHMFFSGNQKYPNKEALNKEIISKSGSINAYTNRHSTDFVVNIHEDKLEKACEVLFSMISHPLFRKEDINFEKKIVLREVEERRPRGDSLIWKHSIGAICGKKHPLNVPEIGYASHIEKISSDDLFFFHDKYYHSGNANIICGGSFSFRKDVLLVLEKVFGKMKIGLENPVAAIPVLTGGGFSKLTDKRYGKNIFELSYVFPKLSRKDAKILEFLRDCMGDGSGKPLFEELRQKRGLVYSLDLSVNTVPEFSAFEFSCNLEPQNFDEANEVFLQVLKNLDRKNFIKCMKEEQDKRDNYFNPPMKACKGIINEIITRGNLSSYYEDEEMEDSLLLEDVFNWKDKLLAKNPFVIHFIDKV